MLRPHDIRRRATLLEWRRRVDDWLKILTNERLYFELLSHRRSVADELERCVDNPSTDDDENGLISKSQSRVCFSFELVDLEPMHSAPFINLLMTSTFDRRQGIPLRSSQSLLFDKLAWSKYCWRFYRFYRIDAKRYKQWSNISWTYEGSTTQLMCFTWC